MLVVDWRRNRGFTLVGSDLCRNPRPSRRETQERRHQPHLSEPRRRGEKAGERTWLEIYPEYGPALTGLKEFSHLWVFYWFHGNDKPEERRTLQVHPRRDPANPLTGVFACRAPVRPNLIGFTACRIIKVEGNVVEVADLDAMDGSPILDLKPYIPTATPSPRRSPRDG